MSVFTNDDLARLEKAIKESNPVTGEVWPGLVLPALLARLKASERVIEENFPVGAFPNDKALKAWRKSKGER